MEPTSIPSNVSSKMGSTPIIIGLIVAVLIASLAYVFVKSPKKDEVVVETPVVSTSETNGNGAETSMHAFVCRDGVYTAVGNYTSPGGSEEVEITLTLKDDVIIDAMSKNLATRPTSVTMQNQFGTGFKALIVGKKIDTVSLDKVSGSSLTPKGFNDAVFKIKAQAKV